MGSVNPPAADRYDVLIIGAGLSGICSLHHVRQRFPQWRVRVLEAADGVGGTWHWNRYPGARVDAESVSYGYSWDKELLQEWRWKEAFSPQADTLEYIQRICAKHDLNKDIQLDTRVVAAHWQERSRSWLFQDDTGHTYAARFLVSCVGFLSAPTLPAIPGIPDFRGAAFHTSRWPAGDAGREFAHKRVGVIGTGATGLQVITELAKDPEIASLTVFQRSPSWSAPLRNTPITPEQMDQHRAGYDALFQACAETPHGFVHAFDTRTSSEVSDVERRRVWEEKYAEPGFGKWVGVFKDTYSNREANRLYSEFMADKIRQRVRSPEVADCLIPTDHGFGTKRVPLESGYFESYNQNNVHLIDLKKTPIERITSKGIETSDGVEHELDVIVFATGFDAITGAFKNIDWRAKDGRPLLPRPDHDRPEQAIWPNHQPRTFLGLAAPALPNTFMVLGPHQPFGNATRNLEHAARVVVDLLQHCHDNNYTYVEPSEQAVQQWTEHVVECSKGQLANEVDSWMTGVNKNLKEKTMRSVARYSGHAVEYRRRCAECQNSGWEGFIFD